MNNTISLLSCLHQKIYELKEKIESYISKNKIINFNDIVFIKPNFVAPFQHATTNLDLICLVVEIIKDYGAIPVIGESSGYEFATEEVFKYLRIDERLKQYNLKILNLDNYKFSLIETKSNIFKKVELSEKIFESDKIINMPKLKMHKVSTLSLAMKNLFGLYSKKQRQKIHIINLNEGIIVINEIIKPDLVIMDALTIVMNAAVYGRSLEINKILLSQTNIGMDLFICDYLNFPFYRIKYLNDYVIRKKIDPSEYQKDGIEDCNRELLITMKRFGNLKYRIMHGADYLYKLFTNRKSIIPLINYKFGIKPVIDKKKCNLCGQCVESCPVKAISIINNEIYINKKLCSQLRCLKCVEECPQKAIKIKRVGL